MGGTHVAAAVSQDERLAGKDFASCSEEELALIRRASGTRSRRPVWQEPPTPVGQGLKAVALTLLVAGVLIALQPVTEWLIHAYVLHLKPIHIGRFTFDPRLARVHRAHHLDPWDLPSLFIPLRTIAIGLVVEPLLFFGLLPSHALAMTALTTATAIGLFYEWSHFLPHTAYRPKLKWWRDVIKYHRLHHFKNEHYWMGVSSSLGDKLLGTFPNVHDVANSDTVRTLLSRDDVTAARANLGSD